MMFEKFLYWLSCNADNISLSSIIVALIVIYVLGVIVCRMIKFDTITFSIYLISVAYFIFIILWIACFYNDKMYVAFIPAYPLIVLLATIKLYMHIQTLKRNKQNE